MICFHHNDLDGHCAAAIVRYWNETLQDQIRFVELDYKSPVPVESIGKDEDVVIVDFSFKPDVMEAVLTRTQKVIWLDHHATAKEYIYSKPIAGIRDFSEKGMSGCELAWRFMTPDGQDFINFPRAVSLIGDYDSWRLEAVPDSLRFYEGMKLREHGPESDLWSKLFARDCDCGCSELCDIIIKQGETAIRYRDNYCASMRKAFGYETRIGSPPKYAYACNIYQFGSPGFAELMDEYPVCIAYAHDGKQFTVSLYSSSPCIDVSEIAKQYGGGGHKGAAGFICTTLPFKPDEVEK